MVNEQAWLWSCRSTAVSCCSRRHSHNNGCRRTGKQCAAILYAYSLPGHGCQILAVLQRNEQLQNKCVTIELSSSRRDGQLAITCKYDPALLAHIKALPVCFATPCAQCPPHILHHQQYKWPMTMQSRTWHRETKKWLCPGDQASPVMSHFRDAGVRVLVQEAAPQPLVSRTLHHTVRALISTTSCQLGPAALKGGALVPDVGHWPWLAAQLSSKQGVSHNAGWDRGRCWYGAGIPKRDSHPTG